MSDQPASTEVPSGIAIIGMAGKFPGAPDLETFWSNLANGVESVTHFTEEELELPSEHVKDPNFVKARAVLADVDLFDADFFGIQPREAEHTDPQHRLFLQTAWEALESAGYDAERYDGSIGVFGGCSQNTYMLANLASQPDFLQGFLNAQQYDPHPALLGNDKDFLTSRVAYKLNLRGPAMSVQSACSTSLVAVVQACQALFNFQCDIALAGGASITFPQKRGYLYKEGAIVSPDGTCRPFDASCQGTVFGDGVGLVALKRADEAVRDGDQILAIIRGFAVNNDGSGKVSYMAPSVDGQAEVVSAAQALAGIEADSISYIEAHGTGTSLGDPIEVAALTKAFRATTDKVGFCAIGAVKGNIGHLESAAGVTGLIKTVLALRHRQLPPTLHYSAPNPKIDFARSPFYVNAKLADWPEGPTPRRAGVSSFGVGGTNAHVVVEEAPMPAPEALASPWQLLPISARTPEGLEQATNRLINYLSAHPEIDRADAAFTLQAGRRIFAHRQAIVCRAGDDLPELVAKKTPGRFFGSKGATAKCDVAFLLPGQGAQQVDMGRDFYEHNALYREHVDACCRLLEPMLGLDLRDVLYPAAEGRTESQRRLAETHLTQPALFVVEYALAQVWLSWGVKPRILVGHSLGEHVAACLAEIFTLPDALHLLATRARLMQEMPGGSMLAVALPQEKLVPLLTGDLALAAVNGPTSCVVSGPTAQALAWQEKLASEGIVAKALCTSHAFHSPMMDPILKKFEDVVAQVPRRAPKIPIVSTHLGRLARDEEWIAPSYWSGQLRHAVRFADAVGVLMHEKNLALLEVGPGQTLTALARQHPAKPSEMLTAHSLPRKQGDSETASMLGAAGQLWMAEAEISLAAVHNGAARRRVPLPTYPFELKRYWIGYRAKPEAKVPPVSATSTARPPSIGLYDDADNVPVDYLPLGDSAVEELITDQLRLMEQQLQLLRGSHVALKNGEAE